MFWRGTRIWKTSDPAGSLVENAAVGMHAPCDRLRPTATMLNSMHVLGCSGFIGSEFHE